MAADFDWARLAEVVEPKRDTQRLLWDEAKSDFHKVAWDVYKPLDGPDQLWELRDGEDGKKYLYAMYDSTPPSKPETPKSDEITVRASSDWTAICDRDRKNVTLSFKGFPLKRFASDEYKFSTEEAERFASFLQAKTAESEFVRQVLKGLPIHMAKLVSGNKTNSEE